jgi:hypothetical protein
VNKKRTGASIGRGHILTAVSTSHLNTLKGVWCVDIELKEDF